MQIPFLDRYLDKKLQRKFEQFVLERQGVPKVPTGERAAWGRPYLSYLGGSLGPFDPAGVTLEDYAKMRHSPQIAAGLGVIKGPLLAAQWWVECEDKAIEAFIGAQLKRLWYPALRGMLLALDFGFSALEKVWVLDGRGEGSVSPTNNGGEVKVSLKKLKDLDPRTLEILADERGDFAGLKQTYPKEVTLPPEKCLIFTHQKEFGNLYGTSRLRPAYEPWYWQSLMYQFCNRYFERRGAPPIKATAPPGKTLVAGTEKDNLDLIYQAAAGLKDNAVVAMPSLRDGQGNRLWDLEFLEDDKRGEMFLAYIEHLDQKILRALLVPDRLITQQEAGSYALARVHADIFLMQEEALLADILDHLNSYLLPQMVIYNFGAGAPRAYVRSEGLSADTKPLLKEVFLEMVRQGRAYPAAEELAKALGIKIEESKEEK